MFSVDVHLQYMYVCNHYPLQHFISECVGVGLVGLAVVPWGLGMAFSSLVFGRISIYTPCTVLCAVSITAIQGGVLVFLLSWERQPSYVLVFLASMGWGITDGMWLTFATGELQHLRTVGLILYWYVGV